MKKVYMVLNSTDVSDLLWCVMNAPERSEAERKRHLKVGDVVYLYCRGKLHGEVRVRDVEILDGSDDWQMDSIIDTFAEDARLSEDELRDYWEGAKHPGIIILKDARRFDEALEWHGPVVQNFQYMTPVPR